MEKLIKKLVTEGKINQETAEILLNEIKIKKEKTNRIRINILIYTIATVLIGIGVISFISANDWILKLLNNLPLIKIIALSMVTICSLFGGYKLAFEGTKFPKLGHALIFFSTLLIGGTYALIGQTYNINANNYALMFIWFLSILPVAYIFKNNAINIVSIILFIIGTVFFYSDIAYDDDNCIYFMTLYMPILIGFCFYIVGNIPIIKEKFTTFSLTYKLVGLVPIFIIFLIISLMTLKSDIDNVQLPFFYQLPVYVLAIINIANYMLAKNEKSRLLQLETVYITAILAIILLLMNQLSIQLLIIAVISHIAIISMISIGYIYGYKYEQPRTIGLINWFLVIYLIVNYCHWGWSSMEKATFFIIGGICLLAIGMFLETNRRKIIKKDK